MSESGLTRIRSAGAGGVARGFNFILHNSSLILSPVPPALRCIAWLGGCDVLTEVSSRSVSEPSGWRSFRILLHLSRIFRSPRTRRWPESNTQSRYRAEAPNTARADSVENDRPATVDAAAK